MFNFLGANTTKKPVHEPSPLECLGSDILELIFTFIDLRSIVQGTVYTTLVTVFFYIAQWLLLTPDGRPPHHCCHSNDAFKVLFTARQLNYFIGSRVAQ